MIKKAQDAQLANVTRIQDAQKEIMDRKIRSASGTSAIDVKSVLAKNTSHDAASEVTAQIVDKQIPQIIKDFDKSMEGITLPLEVMNKKRADAITKGIIESGSAAQQAASLIQQEAMTEAEQQVKLMNLGTEFEATAIRERFTKLTKVKTEEYAKTHKFESATPAAKIDENQIKVLMSQKQSLEENIGSLTKFAEGGVIAKLNASLPKAGAALEEFNTKLSTSTLNSAISATSGIVKSVNELAAILGTGDSATMKIGEKLQRFANNSGLGKNAKYEIKNGGIVLKLDLKIVMDAGEVEKAIFLRKDSIIFDVIDQSVPLTDSQTAAINEVKQKRGGV